MANPDAPITGTDLDVPREHFNRTINEMFTGVRDYVAGHYLLNTRDDSPYWKAVRDQSKPPGRLLKLMACWDNGGDFPELLGALGADRIYSMASWYCLFSGMGRFPTTTGVLSAESEKLIRELKSFCGGNSGRFNEHRAYLQALK
ncbi:tryptophan 7-halogenase [Microbulbifer agarilyticus]|uniref:tryptophan 7-halogenase n=1 Tax=Microbulbifer agarilyticus TaxID=260552 RepID=UPI001C9587F4|nr:tryptophan 7-halogenase [Microbulbifer agarilyticus]MBY6188968.1 tryptophan 7-halogenase [Microbulbifer agarilyticus]